MGFFGVVTLLGQLVLVAMGAIVIATALVLTGLIVLEELGVSVLPGLLGH